MLFVLLVLLFSLLADWSSASELDSFSLEEALDPDVDFDFELLLLLPFFWFEEASPSFEFSESEDSPSEPDWPFPELFSCDLFFLESSSCLFPLLSFCLSFDFS